MSARYPLAIWKPWGYQSPQGPTYFKGGCTPSAVVLHVMAGYATTAVQWAAEGHYGASWHYTVARDGTVYQHLEHTDGGYQAGIPASNPKPRWSLWRGYNVNVNSYTLGIEHEGFPGSHMTAAQADASRRLCKWIAEYEGFPYDREHFPPHADIDLINRPSDFNEPALREQHYKFLFEEVDDMTDQEREDLKNLVAVMGGSAKLKENAARGNDFILGYSLEQEKLAKHMADKAAHR